MAKQIEFNEQFKKAIDVFENSESHVFLTGKAGTGKSTLLQYFRGSTKKNIVVLAPTGVAAVNIQGQTIHSFFRFMPGVTEREARQSAKKLASKEIFKKLDAIVIDEISMVRADLLDLVDLTLRLIRKSSEPFGGIQIVMIGDLYQLAPVTTWADQEIFRSVYASPYFFDSKVIQNLIENHGINFLELEKIYRQSDQEFISFLNAVRNKSLTDEHVEEINRSCLNKTCLKKAIYLTSLNQQADEINFLSLEKIKKPKKVYEGEISGNFREKDLPTEMNLSLKPGARVMFLNNDKLGRWINGTMGTVTKIFEDFVEVKTDEGETFETGWFMWEMFQFQFDKKSNSIEKESVGSFTQIPLRLAWAVTIHKSQGKTFDEVIIDVGTRGTFASGQMYVALSRCTSIEGLSLKQPLKKTHVLLDYRVMKFLTNFQYFLSKEKLSDEDKIAKIVSAIKQKANLTITYLKAKDEKSKREITPKKMETMDFKGHEFLGLLAFCHTRGEERVFNVERILEIETV